MGATDNLPELRTERLVLRNLTMDDVDRIARVANDKRIARNMTAAFPHPYTVDDARAFIESDPYGWAIEPVEPVATLGPGLVGVVGGASRAEGSPSVYEGVHLFGYWLTPDAWGRGFATEAGATYLDHVTQALPIRRIEAGVYAWNPGSGRVLEKLGFTLEGRLRNRISRFGEVTDELIYGKVVNSADD